MERVLAGLKPSVCLVYLDDVLVLTADEKQMCQKLDEVFQRFRESNLRVNGRKCHFGLKKIRFLAHILTNERYAPDSEKNAIIRDHPVPDCVRKVRVRSFVGMVSYYRKFIKGFSEVAAPLYLLLRKDEKFIWSAACQQAFERLKSCLLESLLWRTLILKDHLFYLRILRTLLVSH